MGTWNIGPFDNDDASDLVDDVIKKGVKRAEDAIGRVLKVGSNYLEAPEAQQGIAAAEIIAQLSGGSSAVEESIPELSEWTLRQLVKPSEEVVHRAQAAVNRVLAEPSELLELWSEAEEFDAWRASVQGLADRLATKTG
jgi:hypothetical protein